MSAFTGTPRLVRLALRRDRITLPSIMALILAFVGGSAPALVAAYPDYESQFSYIASSAPSIVGRLFQGPVSGVSIGSILMAEVFLSTAVIMGIMSIFIITRHTRHNEETGAGELIGSTVVGRSAPLTAALVVAIGVNILTALLLFGMLANVPELDTYGSFIFSSALALSGIFMACVAAITAQLSDYRRGANAMAIGLLGVSFIIRGFGDAIGSISDDGLSVTASWVSWISPLGWANQALPYSSNALTPLILLVVVSVVATFAAFVLMAHRDIGSSIFQTKAGAARAKPRLLGAFGLTKRLHKGNIIGWSIGFFTFGIMIGVITNDFKTTFEDNEVFQNLLAAGGSGRSFSDTVFAAMFPITIAFFSGYVVSAMSKIQNEEATGRIEHLLGTAMSRTKWLGTHILISFLGICITIALFGYFAATGYVLAASTPESSFVDIFLSSIANVPAMTVFMGAVLLIFSIQGRFLKSIAWAMYAYIALAGTLVSAFNWPEWVANASPFVHTPQIPADSVDLTPIIILSAIAFSSIAFAFVLFRNRDLRLT